jgi:hypothetical protein
MGIAETADLIPTLEGASSQSGPSSDVKRRRRTSLLREPIFFASPSFVGCCSINEHMLYLELMGNVR